MSREYLLSCEATFDAAHHIPSHPKCGRPHGHRWRVVVTLHLRDAEVPASGFFVDFGKVKNVLKEFDHTDINEFMEVPTCENLATHFARRIERLLPPLTWWQITVQVFETPASSIVCRVTPDNDSE